MSIYRSMTVCPPLKLSVDILFCEKLCMYHKERGCIYNLSEFDPDFVIPVVDHGHD